MISQGRISDSRNVRERLPKIFPQKPKILLDLPDYYVTIWSHLNSRRTDRVFKALGDRTRRRMLDLLVKRPRTTGELAAAFPGLSRFAVMKHLRVLQKAGLLLVTKDGRKRWNSLNPVPLQEVFRRWVGANQQLWADALLNIRDAAEADAPAGKSKEGEPS
jgi:DNA-binding transcriptional ArsR family regulator